MIIKDLVPHIDATYRTIASREGRGVNGFSMGGFGAAHLGFKYPDVFGVDSIMAPPLVEPGLTGLPAQAWSRLFPSAMDSDMEYWKTNNPFELAVKNADSFATAPSFASWRIRRTSTGLRRNARSCTRFWRTT